MILVVYLGHGTFIIRKHFFFSPKQFLGEVLSYQHEETQKKILCASIVARVRSMQKKIVKKQ